MGEPSVVAALPSDGRAEVEAWLRGRAAPAVLARTGGENFPVAMRILPAVLRRDLRALYAYARLVDDLGDEAPGDRGAGLDLLAADLDRIWAGPAGPELPVLRELVPTVRAHDLPAEPFRDLLAANRQDQEVARYASFSDLLGYCRLSADPVGRLVLAVFGAATPERVAASDSVCTALQLLEHAQDVGEDLGRNRVYLPAEDLERYGVTEVDLLETPAGPAVRRLVAFEATRARGLLTAGAGLVGSLTGWARLAVAGFVGGGLAAYEALERVGFDSTGEPPKPTPAGMARHALAVYARGGAA